MQKIIKVLAGLIGIVILLGIAAIVALIAFVNPNDFKPQITQQVYKLTGRQLSLNGSIHWSFFPWLGLAVNEVSLSNAAGFGARPFAQIKEADINIKLLPLFSKHIEIGTLKLHGLELHLVKNKQGVTNWQDLTKSDPTTKYPVTTSTSTKTTINVNPQTKIVVSPPLTLAIAAINITDGHITWDDQQKNQSYDIRNLQLHSKAIQLGQAFPLDLQCDLTGTPKLNTSIQLSAKITANPDQKTYALQQLKLTDQLRDKAYANGVLNINLQSDVTANLAKETLAMRNVVMTIANLKMQGELQGNQILTTPAIQGHLAIPTFNLNQFLAALGNPTANKRLLQQVAANFDLQATSNNVNINKLQLRCADIAATGDINVNMRSQTPIITTNMQFNNVQLEPLFLDFVGPSRLQITGIGNLTTHLTMQSGSDSILNHLSGQGRLTVTNGVIKGINIPYWINVGKALIDRQVPPQMGANQTDFGNLTATYTINNAVLTNNDLLLRAPTLQANGQGSINLVKQNLDYKINAQLLDVGTQKPQGIVIPLRITGSFANIHVQPDVEAIIQSQAKQEIKKQINNVIEKNLPAGLGGALQQQLNNFLK